MPGGPLLAGLDVGTTRVKGAVYDAAGGALAAHSLPTPGRSTRPGWASHDPEELWAAAASALRGAVSRLPDDRVRDVAGVAVASMAEAGVALDAAGRPVYEVIAWHDERAAAQATRLAERVGAGRLREVTGLAPHPILGLCKLLWLKEEEPEVFARARRWLNVADFVAFRLSGVAATDRSLATRTLALDLDTFEWSEEILGAAGVPATLFAPLCWGGVPLGEVSPAAAEATGLPAGAVVAAGGHDHVCAALAAGVVEAGRALDSVGTAESVLVPLPHRLPPEAGWSQGAHVAAGRRYASGGIHAAGASLEWVAGLVGSDHATLAAAAAEVTPGAWGIRYVPRLRGGDGERAALAGLSPDASPAAVYRAVVEGLAVTATGLLDGITAAAGLAEPPEVRLVGGGARNGFLVAVKAAVAGRPLLRPDLTEATCLGAALLGGVGAGVYPDAPAAAAAVTSSTEEITPDPGWTTAYATLRPEWELLRRRLDAAT